MKKVLVAAIKPHNVQRGIVLLASTIVVLFVLYIYFVSSAVTHVVIRKELDRDMVALNTDIAELEAKYIAAQHQVSQTIARLDGYTPVRSKVFIDRTTDTLVLSELTP